nr:glyoxylate/hydroxypyruvate reductase A [Tanacetum cinerariifolium]
MALLYKADPARAPHWRMLFAEHAPDIEWRAWPDIGNAEEIEYLAAWQAPDNLQQLLPRSVGSVAFAGGSAGGASAGSGHHEGDVRIRDVGGVEFASGYAAIPRAAGRAVLAGASVATRREPACGGDGIGHTGAADSGNTGAVRTEGILDRNLFALLPRGAGLINMGRGGHLVEEDLLEALDSGQLGGAVLDVLQVEPAAADHPFWDHPQVVLTPHVAAMTQPASAFGVLLENI